MFNKKILFLFAIMAAGQAYGGDTDSSNLLAAAPLLAASGASPETTTVETFLKLAPGSLSPENIEKIKSFVQKPFSEKDVIAKVLGIDIGTLTPELMAQIKAFLSSETPIAYVETLLKLPKGMLTTKAIDMLKRITQDPEGLKQKIVEAALSLPAGTLKTKGEALKKALDPLNPQIQPLSTTSGS